MKIFLTILFSVLLSANFTNDGAVLTIDEGCIVTFDGDYESTGSLNLNGTLQTSGVLGDVITIAHGATGLVEFTGDNQTIPSDIYMNILLSGGGTKLVDDNMVIIQYDFTIADGNLDLNDGTLSMLGTSTLIETPGNVVFGEGEIVANYFMPSNPTYMNYAGLGLSHNIFGVGGVERRHTTITSNDNSSINRWYSVTVEEGAVSDISFQYDETELNGLDESALLLFHSVDGENWSYIESILDTENNTLSATAIEENGHFTAAGGGGCTDPLAANYDEQAFGENGTCEYAVSLGAGNNLMSFPGTPALTSTQALLETIEEQNPGCEVSFILGQGQGLFNTPDGWSGNLSEVNKHSGYWINTSCSIDWLVSIPKRETGCVTYDIGAGNNLVSYIGEDGAETLSSLWEGDNFNFILGQGVGLFKTVDEWSGNLNQLSLFKGYWLNSSSTFNFSWGEDCQDIPVALAKESASEEKIFDVLQSTEQAFYLIKDLEVIGMNPQEGDWILAYRGDELIGSAEYEEGNTTLAVMGKDITEGTEHFPRDGEPITLKIFNHKTMGVHDLNGEIPVWTSLGVSILDKLEGSSIIIPDNFVLEQPYPNPFNPTTTVKFGLPHDTEVSLRIYDLQGRMIEELTQGYLTAGYHSFQWDADNLASGVYFVNLISKDFVSTQKLMLLK
jgi:hypothetical protein